MDTKLDSNLLRQLVRCKQQFHGSSRYDWVVLYDVADKKLNTRQEIDKYLFAQVRLFFKIQQDDKVHQLAYVEWFNIVDVDDPRTKKKIPRDLETGMAVAEWTGQFNVVSVDAIVRTVHMQPLFEECDSARKSSASKLDVCSIQSYLVNKYADYISWEELF